MVASIDDKFTKVGKRGTKTTLSNPGKAVGATSVTIDNPTNWETSTAVIFSIYRTKTDGTEEDGSYTEWIGVLAGSQITGLQLLQGIDQPYQPGGNTVVLIHVTSSHTNRMIDGLLVEHDAQGNHKMTAGFKKLIMDAIIPVGSRMEYYGTATTLAVDYPGWLLIGNKGTIYNKTDYPRLYTHLQTVDATMIIDANSFSLDKFVGRVAVQRDSSDTDFDTLGKTGGQKSVQAHSHKMYVSSASGSLTAGPNGSLVFAPANTSADNSGTTGTGVTNMNPFNTFNYIIKY